MSWARSADSERDAIEKSRTQIASDRDAVQKKTFTKWINSHLLKAGLKADDLYVDLRDGKLLKALLEMFTGATIKMEKGKMRLHKLTNLNKLLEFLNEQKIDTLNINSSDILDGNPKLTLALVWRLILHYQLSTAGSGSEGLAELKQVILDWCRNVTEGYDGVDVTNFTSSWRSGLAFNAIINRFRPDLIDFDALDQGDVAGNMANAFDVAEKELGVPNLLDIEDMASPDERSVLTYISFYVKAFPEAIPPRRRSNDIVQDKLGEYERCARPLMAWIEEQKDLLIKADAEPLPQTLDSIKAIDFNNIIPESEISAKSTTKSQAEKLYGELQALIAAKSSTLAVQDGLHSDDINKAWSELMEALAARQAKLRDQLSQLEVAAQLEAEEEKLASSWKEYADTAEPLLAWIEKKTDELNGVELSDQTGEMEALLQTLTRDMDSDDWTANAAQKDRAGVLFKAFEKVNADVAKPMEIPSELHFDTVEQAWKQLQEIREKQLAAVASHLSSLKERDAQKMAEDSWEQYEAVASPLMVWISEKQLEVEEQEVPESLEDVQLLHKKMDEELQADGWKGRVASKDSAKELFASFQELNTKCPSPVPVKEGLHFDNDVQKAWEKLMAARERKFAAVSEELARLEQEMSAQHKADDSWDKYEAVASPLMAWIAEKQAELDENAANEDIAAVKLVLEKLSADDDWKLKFSVKRNAEDLFRTFQDLNEKSPSPHAIADGLHFDDDVLQAWNKLMADRDELLTSMAARQKRLLSEEAENEKAAELWGKYKVVAQPLVEWISEKQKAIDDMSLPDDLEEMKVLVAELAAEKDSQEWKDKGQIKDSAEELFIAFKKLMVYCSAPVPIQEGLHFFDDVQPSWDKLNEARLGQLAAAEAQLASLQARKDASDNASRCWQEYAAVASPLMAWIDAKQAETDELVVPEGIEELKVFVVQLNEAKESPDWKENTDNRAQAETLFAAFMDANSKAPEQLEVEAGLHFDDDVQKAWDQLMSDRELKLLAAAEEQLKRREEELARQQEAEDRWQRYEAVASPLVTWIFDKDDELKQLYMPEDIDGTEALLDTLAAMKAAPAWTDQEGNLSTAHKLFEDFQDANAVSAPAVAIKEGLHASDDVQPAWDALCKSLSEAIAKATTHLEELRKKSQDEHLMQEIDLCHGALEDIKDKIDTFQADRGQPDTRENMKITAKELATDLQEWRLQESKVADLVSSQELEDTPLESKVEESLARFKSLNDVANVLEARVAASDDALALLSDVDAFLQLELNEKFEDDFEVNKSQIATMRDNYDQLREKFDAQLEPSYCNPHDLQEQVSLCATHWDSLCNLLSQDVGKPVEDADKWLSEVEAQLEKNGPLYHRSTDVDAKQLTPLKALNDDIAGRQSAVFEAARRGEAISATEDSLSVKLLAAGIPKRLIAVQEECKCRVECVESAVSCLSEYETELNSLKNWLAWAEGELSKLKQLQSEPQVVQQQVDECQKLLSDVRAHEPYVRNTSSQGDASVDKAKHFDKLVKDFRSALEGAALEKRQTFEDAMDEAYSQEDLPVARDAIPVETKDVSERYEKLTQAFSHRLSRLESRLVKTERVHGLFESLRAFLRGAEETKLVDETSRLPADVSVIDHKIVEISSLGDRMEDGFVLLGDATSSFEDLQADIEEDEIVPAGGDETDAPGPLAVLGAALSSLKNLSLASLTQLGSLKDCTVECENVFNKASLALQGIESDLKADETASCEEEILKKQTQDHLAIHEKLLTHQGILDKAKASCEALVARSDVLEESKDATRQQLRDLESRYEYLMSLSTARKDQLQETGDLLTSFRGVQTPFCDWLGKEEAQMAMLTAVSVDCAALKLQAEETKDFLSRVEAKDADKEELLQVGSKLLLVSNKTAAELCPRPGVQEESSVDSQEDRLLDNWVKSDCETLPKRYAALQMPLQSRLANVETMENKAEKYVVDKQALDKFIDETGAELSELESSQGTTVEVLQEQLDKVQGIIARMDEKESAKDGVMDTGEGIVQDYEKYLGECKEARDALPSGTLDGDNIPLLDGESKPAVEALQSGASRSQSDWDELRQRAACLEGGLSTKLDLLKDAGGVMDGLLQSLAAIAEKVNNLPLISADRGECEEQIKENQNLLQELAKVRTQFSVLDDATEASTEFAAARQQADEQCDALEARLKRRSDGFDACDEVLTTDEGLNSWMDGVVEKIDHLPDTPERPLLVAMRRDAEEKRAELQQLQGNEKAACENFESDIDAKAYDERVQETDTRLKQLEAKVGDLFKELEGMEDLFDRHRELNDRLAEYQSWLNDFNEEDRGKIGLKQSVIADVCQLRQDRQANLDMKYAELKEFRQSEAFSGLSGGELNGFDGANALDSCDDLLARLEKACNDADFAATSANEALVVVESFESPFAQLYPQLSDFEEQLSSVKPITGMIEHTEEQHKQFETLQQEIANAMPNVNTTCENGEKLKSMSEADNRDKEEFGQNVANMQRRWEMLKATAVEVCERHRVACDRTSEFIDDHLNPLMDWIMEVEPLLGEKYTIGGDAAALDELQQKFDQVSSELSAKGDEYQAAMSCGNKLMSEILDDKSFTTEQLEELTQRWQDITAGLEAQLKRLTAAKERLAEFVLALPEAEELVDEAMSTLEDMAPVSNTDLRTAEAQETEMGAFGQEHLAPCVEAVNECLVLCQELIDSSPPHRKEDLTEAHADLAAKLTELQEATDARNLKVKAALLELRGLADTIELLETSLDDAENELNDIEKTTDSEREKKKTEIESLQKRLASVRNELAEVSPELEALVKVKEERENSDAAAAAGNPQMQTVGVMSDTFSKLIKRSEQLGADLEDAMTAAIMLEDENFDVEAWRKKFVAWLDENDVNSASVFRHFDADNSQELSRDELFEGLATCGFPMRPRHIDKVLDHFDEDNSGTIDKWEFLVGLRPERRVQFDREARTDDEKINHAVRTAVSRCTCSKQFRMEQINAFTYRFGDSQLKRMVRILRTNVMVRVGGGWEDLNQFLNKHDPCRATGRTNLDLRGLKAPGEISELKAASTTPTRMSKRTSTTPAAHTHEHVHGAECKGAHSKTPERKHPMKTRSQSSSTLDKKYTPHKPVTSSGYGIRKTSSGGKPTGPRKDSTDGGLKPSGRSSPFRKSVSASNLPGSQKATVPSYKSGLGPVKSSGYGQYNRPTRVSAGDAAKRSSLPKDSQPPSSSQSPHTVKSKKSPRPRIKMSAPPPKPEHIPVVPDVLGGFAAPTISSTEKTRSRSPSVSPESSPKSPRKTEEINPHSRLMAPTTSSLGKTSPKVQRKALATAPDVSNGNLAVSPTSSVMPVGRAGSGSSIPLPTSKHS